MGGHGIFMTQVMMTMHLQDDDVDGSGDFFEGSGEDDEELGSTFYPLEW